MTAPSTILERASKQLADPDYECWDKSCLLSYYNEALCTLSGLRPTAFAECVDLPLVTGTKQILPDEYATLLSIEGDESEEGDTGATYASSDMVRSLRGKVSCLVDDDCATYAVTSFRHHPSSDSIFYVSPNVPAGLTPTVEAVVVPNPAPIKLCDLNEESGVDCRMDALILDWVLYRAYGQESESQTSLHMSRRYQAAFYDGVNGTYRVDSRLRSGHILGQTGTGDERLGWRNQLQGVGR